NGNIGIGTTVPQAPLAVGATGPFRVASTGAVTAVGLSNSGTAITNSAAYTQSGTGANTFTGTSTFSNATISALFSGGNVGLGSATPDARLDVNGNVKFWTGAGTNTNATAD